ncbi:metallophosphoesterase [Parasulfuritortus cantonensis]|uniref:Metallophosphoesterase n=1 Tax=Parasulfuritortus cantonensis TaxID=2528202 RepID=A0A4R1B1N0_9PROT|nr:metallophosphoesterase [Parasulfuritortus cantonensis]TCJ11701.1 metallophosphoesterase [Parasulfuritortus cantonensis]
MNRREFLKTGSLGLAGLALGGQSLPWLIDQAVAGSLASGQPWKFGVMADTQWSNKNDPDSPATCAVNIIEALNQQFIAAGVKFVVQVGDLVNTETWNVTSAAGYTDPFGNAAGTAVRTLPYRAWAAQSLYDHGIGFFPLRGNHEGSQTAANELPALFPQTLGEADAMYGVSKVVASTIDGLKGLSYAFDFGNVRIVMLDQFTRKDGSGADNSTAMLDQLAWVDNVLADRPAGSHAFVMAHKNLIGQNHADCLFGANATTNPEARNQFIGSLQANQVGLYLGGHDHMHHRSLIASPDRSAQTQQIICSSNSYKFYIPKGTPNDTDGCETVVAQELFTIGYYLFTVDGPCLTVEFYSSSHGEDYGDVDLTASPLAGYQFFLRERFGYSLNGKQFDIANGESYTKVQDSHAGTTAKILSGSNADTAGDQDYNGRAETKTVRTGWRDRPTGAASAVLKLWGMAENLSLFDGDLTGMLPDSDASTVGDVYVLSLSYDAAAVRPSFLRTGDFAVYAKDADGNWVKAVELNDGGTGKFVYGPWKAKHGLGCYGVDPSTRTVWAVLNRDGEFVAR